MKTTHQVFINEVDEILRWITPFSEKTLKLVQKISHLQQKWQIYESLKFQ